MHRLCENGHKEPNNYRTEKNKNSFGVRSISSFCNKHSLVQKYNLDYKSFEYPWPTFRNKGFEYSWPTLRNKGFEYPALAHCAVIKVLNTPGPLCGYKGYEYPWPTVRL